MDPMTPVEELQSRAQMDEPGDLRLLFHRLNNQLGIILAHAELLDHLRIDRAVFCGLSMGGYVAFSLWRLHPDRVRGLVLLALAGFTKKTPKTPPDLIALAEQRLADWRSRRR